MTKQEILEKAQNKKPNQMDEMEFDIMLKSNRIGLLVGLIGCIIIMFIKMYFDLPYQDVYAILSAIFCAQNLYKWNRQKENVNLFCGILWGITTLLLFAVFIMDIM